MTAPGLCTKAALLTKNIDGAESSFDIAEEGFDRAARCDIGARVDHGVAQFAGERRSAVIVDIGDGDLGALRRQPPHAARANAVGAAGDDCSFSDVVAWFIHLYCCRTGDPMGRPYIFSVPSVVSVVKSSCITCAY